MPGNSWSESEIKAAIQGYWKILGAEKKGLTVNKASIYRELSGRYPERSAKSFERKFQNISAILYQENHPFVDGLKPNIHYQTLLKLLVLDKLERIGRPNQTPQEILGYKLRRIAQRGFLPVKEKKKGDGRFGLALERILGIPQNSSKEADFMGIEIKTKSSSSNTLQTLFSRIPSAYLNGGSRALLLQEFGIEDPKRGGTKLYTSFSSKPDSFGFHLLLRKKEVLVRNGDKDVLSYSKELLEEALLTKHTQTAFVKIEKRRSPKSVEEFRILEVAFCKSASILRFLDLIEQGKVFLNFYMRETNGKIKDHGFSWRIKPEAIPQLYLDVRSEPLK